MNIFEAFNGNSSNMMLQEQMVPRSKKTDEWYHNNADYFINIASFPNKMRNYMLYSNVIDKDDFANYCSDYGFSINVDEIEHKDIISSKVKVLLGIEDYRPFVWTLSSVNEDAIDRKQQISFNQLKEAMYQYLVQNEMEILYEKYGEQIKQMQPEQVQQMIQQMQQEAEQKIMDQYAKWQTMSFKDSIELTAEHVIRYFSKLNKIEDKFDKGFFHAILSAREVYHIAIENNNLNVYVVNPNNISYGESSESEFIEDAEWIVYRLYLTPSEIVRIYGDVLTKDQIERLYSSDNYYQDFVSANANNTLPIYKVYWRSLEKIGILETADGNTLLVDSTYKKNKKLGDVNITWLWVPVIEQCTRIGKDIYINCMLMPNQVRDIRTLYDVKMPFYGATYDSINTKPTSIFDRMVPYQYWYDIVSSKLDKLIYSDEGKKIAMNYNMIPTSSGFNVEKFINYMRKNNIIFLDPNEEGNRGDVNVVNSVKEIDMGYAGQIQQYIMLLEYIEKRMGEAVGISKEMEGIIHQRQAVANTQQAILQSSKILRPIFALHDEIKRRVLKGILDASKVYFMWYGTNSISYALDEFEKVFIKIDAYQLNETKFDIFLENNDKLYDVKKAIEAMANQALAANRIDYESVVKIMKTDSIREAELLLEEASRRAEMMQQQMIQQQQQIEEQKHKWKLEEIQAEGQMQIEREKVKGEYALQKQAMLSIGFNEVKDVDKDKKLDVLEVLKQGKASSVPIKDEQDVNQKNE